MREIDGGHCSCGGEPKREDATPEELEKYNCGRSYECCIRVYQCSGCKVRWLFTLEAPEFNG